MKNTNELLAELNNKFDKLLEIVLDKITPNAQNKTLCIFEFVANWFESDYKYSVSQNTFKRDSGVLKNNVLNKTEYNKLLNEFTRNDLTALLDTIQSTNLRRICAVLLVKALRSAYETGYIKQDLTRNYKMPRHVQKEDRALTRAEEDVFLSRLRGEKIEIVVCVYLFAGLRRGEGLGLERRHIDFENDEIHVEQQVTRYNKLTTTLKTPKSRRTVKMFPWLKDKLLVFKDCPANARLFTFTPNYLTKLFAQFRNDCGIQNFTIKSCRTTFATRCEEMGIPEIIIQSWLGHTTLKMTRKHYIKVNSDFVQAEYEKAIKRKSNNS